MILIKQIIERIKSSDIASRLASGAFWSILGSTFGRGLVLVAFIIVARIIGQKEYGELGIIRSTIIMFSVFSGAGLGLTASRYIALYRNTEPQKVYEIYLLARYFSVGLGFLIALLLCFFAPIIAEKSLHTPELTSDIRYGAVVLFFITVSSAQTGVLQGFERFKHIAINTTAFGIIQILGLSLGAYYAGTKGVILAMALSYLVLCVLNQFHINQNIADKKYDSYKSNKINKETFSVLWKFSLPAVMSTLLVTPLIWWCKTMIVKLNGFEAVANYDVAEQWNTIILFIPATLGGMIIPILSNVLSEGTATQYKKLINVNIIVNTIIVIFVSLCIILLSSFILRWYGTEFNDTRTFITLVLSTIPSAIAAVLGSVIVSKGKMWMGCILNLVWAMWVVLFFFIFVYRMGHGAFGFALAMLVSYMLHAIFSYAYMWAKVVSVNNNIK